MHIEPLNLSRQPPSVQATLASDGVSWRIVCPHCHMVHVHGADEGHRAAHCEKGTKNKEQGYVLVAPHDQQEPA